MFDTCAQITSRYKVCVNLLLSGLIEGVDVYNEYKQFCLRTCILNLSGSSLESDL